MFMYDRRKSHRYLWRSLVISCIAACGAFIYFTLTFESPSSLVKNLKSYSSNPEKLTAETCTAVCDSKECVEHAKMLLDYINPEVDPCENFFEFACGKMFEKSDPGVFYSQIERYSEEVTIKLNKLLVNIEADPSSASGKMKILYDSCMKYGASELKTLQTILNFLHNVGIQGWPNLASDFRFTNTSLSNVIAKLLAHQEFGFIDFSTAIEYSYLEDYSLKVNASVLVSKSPYEKRTEPTRKYLVERILIFFHLDSETINEIWEETQAIHNTIINLKKESDEREDENENTERFFDCSRDTLKEWTDICQSLESLIEITNSSEKVSKDYVYFDVPAARTVHSVKNIFPLLRNFSDRSIANYLALNLFINNMDELNFYFRQANDKVFEDYSGGADVSNVKWKKCTRWIAKNMAFAMGNEYIKSDFAATLLQDGQSIAEECMSEATNLVSRQEWMTEEEKKNVQEEILSTRVNFLTIAEKVTNETEVNIFYEQFHPTVENFFHNVLQYKKFMKIQEMHGHFLIEDKQFSQNLFLTNAVGGGNSIDFFLGLLVPPTYTPGLQRFINVISLGVIFSHEFGHNLENYFYYHVNLTGYYTDKMKCLKEQYSQFVLETIGKNLQGERYQKENVGDNIAISVIDKLIEKYGSDNTSYLLPSFPYSLKQQIFMSSMNMLCTIHTKERDELTYTYSIHPPQRLRINGMMQNSRLFSSVFGCEEGSFMNPTTKCLLLQ